MSTVRIHRLDWFDEDGSRVEWFPSKAASWARVRVLRDEGQTAFTHSVVDIPTTKAGLIDWLTDNLARDNG